MSTWAIVVAAGEGARLGAGGPKALVPLAGTSLLERSLAVIASTKLFAGCVVAAGESWVDEARRIVSAVFPGDGRAVAGGATRQQSVRSALDRVAAGTDRVVVHDAARPLAAAKLFARALAALDRAAGAVCAIPVADTIKRANGDTVAETIDRSMLWRIQTPQAFRFESLLDAHLAAAGMDPPAPDDAALLERNGETVVIVPGDERNLKITTRADLALAEALCRMPTVR